MNSFLFWSRKLSRQTIQLFGSRFYRNPDPIPSKSILVAGTARSGTTWLGDLISTQLSCRILFEPFNPDLVNEYSKFNYFQYMRPEDDDEELHRFAHKVFTGTIRNEWIDRQNERLISSYRLIKEIRANLLLKWINNRFPDVPILFLIRHPCAVVLSRMQLGWATDRDIEPLLSQPDLVSDHLQDKLDLMHAARTDEEKHAIIWCISNLVPLNQFPPGELKIVYYEDLCIRPEVELPSVFKFLGFDFDRSHLRTVDNPSQTTISTSAIVTGSNKISHWKQTLTSSQIERILKVVDAFGLGHIYGDSLMPIQDSHGMYFVP